MFEVDFSEYKKRMDVNFPTIKAVFSRFITINNVKREVIGIGKATCDVNDKFNKDFGCKLAEKRAWINLLKMEEEFFIQMTKQPEWRKEKPWFNVKWTPEIYNMCTSLISEGRTLTPEESKIIEEHLGKLYKPLEPKQEEQQFLTVGEHEKYHKGLRK